MSDRLPWQQDRWPKHFVALMPEGTAKVWWKDRDSSPPAWCYRIEVGQTIRQGTENTKQAAADRATMLWPNIVARENARVSKVEAERHLSHQIDEAHRTGRVDVMAFGLGASDYDRLLKINDILRSKNMLTGTLKPLADAVSAELYRRRTKGRAP